MTIMAAPADYQVNNANPPQIGNHGQVSNRRYHYNLCLGNFRCNAVRTPPPPIASSRATLCLFNRGFSPFKTYQTTVWVTLFICVGSSMDLFLSLLFACKPLSASWDPTLAQTSECLDRGAIYVATAGIGVLTDVLMLALPILIVISLEIPLRQKIILVGLFAVGSATLITFIVRLVILLQSFAKQDQAYALTKGTLWM
ncbi:hypothetical protein BKA67DRAFT_643344 [Truncatella angustata]|uniref:Rhodopsin domain-containing protein n=1 Tax=Truncatella angustata TaxID=152316 RepID=A0A9P8USC2_9PEZI|nr:uncharacterized protein BKA67DRAFT_643344 [Truncatella angustata]KAH6657324.1 hypothetical protein BKA67DRAFT_643344 [Truncatella angustata]